MSESHRPHVDLADLARQAMLERGLEPDYPHAALRQVAEIPGPAHADDPAIRDLRKMAWASIDNDDSRDLDQLSVAEELDENRVRILVAIADVDSLVRKQTPVDEHARYNTTSVYTAARIFAMLPERLSTDLTSLGEHADRLAIVISYVVNPDGSLGDTEVFRALVCNQAKLAYNSVAAWLEGHGEMPPAMARVSGIDAQIRLQDRVARRLRERRQDHGALDLKTIEPKAVVRDGYVAELYQEERNPAKELIEDFMVAANGVTARFLEERNFPTLRRIVRSPERWDRIEALARSLGDNLPPDPDSLALSLFLNRRRKADPDRFPDLSLAIVKLLGSGEYVLNMPGEDAPGHFGLAVRDYTHSTAPNRRYPDMLTQRLLKAALHGDPVPYTTAELNTLATHCTQQEDAANKVERQVRKSAAALFLSSRLGEQFDGIVTGASEKGTWVRTFQPPVEGKLVTGGRGIDVGDKVRVKLIDTNVYRGFIDFALVGR